MTVYNYDYLNTDTGEIETYQFSFNNKEEEDLDHKQFSAQLDSMRETMGEVEFAKFWWPEDQEIAFRKYEGDVLKYIDAVFSPYILKEVRTEAGEVVWRSEHFKDE